MENLKRWKCELCGELMTEQQIEGDLLYCTFPGNRIQPAEYAVHCANAQCKGMHDDQVEVWLCDKPGCEEISMKGDDCCIHHYLKSLTPDDPGEACDFAEYQLGVR